jgi:hypothetical protein
MTQYSVGNDRNGNKVCRVKPRNGRAFSIQTNGNLPKTHRDGVGEWTEAEVSAYVRDYGTKLQREAIRVGVFYEVTLFDGEESFDVHCFADSRTARMADGRSLTQRARQWIRRGFWNPQEVPGWAASILCRQ